MEKMRAHPHANDNIYLKKKKNPVWPRKISLGIYTYCDEKKNKVIKKDGDSSSLHDQKCGLLFTLC